MHRFVYAGHDTESIWIETYSDDDAECHACRKVGRPRILIHFAGLCQHFVSLCRPCFRKLKAIIFGQNVKGGPMKRSGPTQSDIARKVGIHVSAVSKILNRVQGPIFRQETVKRVMRAAKAMDYHMGRPSKRALIDMIVELVKAHPDPRSAVCAKALELVGQAEPETAALAGKGGAA